MLAADSLSDQLGAVYWLHGDHLGSASLTTSITGTKVAELRYLPFGETRWAWGTTPTDRRYTGQREVPAIGLYDYNARMYWPAACPERSRRAGRFVSADTVVPGPGNPQSWNRYSYVFNSPLKHKDDTGHIPTVVVGAIIGGLVGGGAYLINAAMAGQQIDVGQLALTTLAGAGAGALVGSGIGLVAAAAAGEVTAMSAGAATTVGSMLTSAGINAGAAGLGYMANNVAQAIGSNGATGDFDAAEFTANYVPNLVGGAIKGSGVGIGWRIGVDTLAGAGQSAVSDILHGREIEPAKAFGTALAYTAGSIGSEVWSKASPLTTKSDRWIPVSQVGEPRARLSPLVVRQAAILSFQQKAAIGTFRSSITSLYESQLDRWNSSEQ